MNRKDTIRMAREAGLYQKPETYDAYRTEIERFTALVAAAEREARIAAQKQVEALQAENARNEADRLAAVLSEREACAKVCEELSERFHAHAADCAASIRARGQA